MADEDGFVKIDQKSRTPLGFKWPFQWEWKLVTNAEDGTVGRESQEEPYVGRVLIVDDAAFMRKTIRMMLERNGIEVAGEAENGSVAVKQYAELQPDLVTMDITMPEMDGLHAVREILQRTPGAKIIMVSAMGQELLVRDAIMAGAKGFVVKPFKEDALVKSVQKLL